MFADVRIFDPNCRTYKDKEPHLIYSQHESLKNQEYGDRLLNVEHCTLTCHSFFQPQEVGGKGAFTYYVIRFWHFLDPLPPPPSSTVIFGRPPPPWMTSSFLTPPLTSMKKSMKFSDFVNFLKQLS